MHRMNGIHRRTAALQSTGELIILKNFSKYFAFKNQEMEFKNNVKGWVLKHQQTIKMAVTSNSNGRGVLCYDSHSSDMCRIHILKLSLVTMTHPSFPGILSALRL